MTERHGGVEQAREQRCPNGSLSILRQVVVLTGKTTRVIESVVERLGNSLEIAPAQKFSQPDKYFQRRTEFVGPHEASLSNSGPPDETSHLRCRPYAALNILNHAIQGFALDRGGDIKLTARATKLAVAIDSRGFRFRIRGSQQDLEKFWCGSVVMLSVTEKLVQILLEKPVEISDPVQPLGMNDDAESRISQEGAASGRRFRIVTVDRDDGFEIAKGLSLQAIKSFTDEIGAFVDG